MNGGTRKVAVYNKYWRTAGGAEKYGGAIAQHLARRFDVDLLVHEPFDADELGERLGLDFGGIRQVELDVRPGAVAAASEGYDLLVNVSYMSTDRSRARRGIYVVHFPTSPGAHLTPLQRAAVRVFRSLPRAVPVGMEWGDGFHHRDHGRRAAMWTTGDGVLRFTTDPAEPIPVELTFSHQRPAAAGDAHVSIEIDGRVVAGATLPAAATGLERRRGVRVRFGVRSPEEGDPVEVRIRSGSFVPAEVVGGDDRRTLGVPLRSIRVGVGAVSRLAALFPVLLSPPENLAWADTYDVIVANSQFTRSWIRTYWDLDSTVLYPPVSLQRRGEKEPLMLGVGRFFEAHKGHSKKQLELVRAFRKLHETGTTGWSLHLVGGCAPDAEPYVAQVREAARGLPVELHVNAPGAVLRDLYARASIYWHASGYGEHAERHPDRLEHFGITTVEAMSAGAVPIVFGAAGQLETVRHGVDGFHFRSLDDLVALTRMVIDDDRLRERCAASSEHRAAQFSIEAFGERLDELVDRVCASPVQ